MVEPANHRKISSIAFSEWRHFRPFRIDFDDSLTIITGANGAGKTTILELIAPTFANMGGRVNELVAQPSYDESGALAYQPGFYARLQDHRAQHALVQLATLSFAGDEFISMVAPSKTGQQFAPSAQNVDRPIIQGTYFGARRLPIRFLPVDSIPLRPPGTCEQILQDYRHGMWEYRSGRIDGTAAPPHPQFVIKQSMLSFYLHGRGLVSGFRHDADDMTLNQILQQLEEKLRVMLPSELNFSNFVFRIPEILLKTSSGLIALDALSGGAAALFEMTWQLTMILATHQDFIVLIDEPENHLHPEMQKTILPKLLTAFPSAQFIVATHSPLVVNSVEKARVYALRFEDVSLEERAAHLNNPLNQKEFEAISRKVVATRLDDFSKGGTPDQILKEVLGVDFAAPVWAAEELERIVEEFLGKEITDELVTELQNQLEAKGLLNKVPVALAELVKFRTDDQNK
jgi:predicted ATPase